MNKKDIQKTFLITAIVSAFIGSFFTYGILQTQKPNQDELIKEFYNVENAVHVSPHTIRKKMDRGDTSFTLVDLRSQEEYEKEHIVGAINIPTYKDPNTSISIETEAKEKERILNSFKELQKQDKEIVTYCYSMPCMTGRKVGKLLSDNGIYVKTLNIGWNEWRYFWDLWNHDAEDKVDPKDYIVSGKEPGKPKLKDVRSSCGAGELGC